MDTDMGGMSRPCRHFSASALFIALLGRNRRLLAQARKNSGCSSSRASSPASVIGWQSSRLPTDYAAWSRSLPRCPRRSILSAAEEQVRSRYRGMSANGILNLGQDGN
jgi:hypothetical protein